MELSRRNGNKVGALQAEIPDQRAIEKDRHMEVTENRETLSKAQRRNGKGDYEVQLRYYQRRSSDIVLDFANRCQLSSGFHNFAFRVSGQISDNGFSSNKIIGLATALEI